MCDDYVEEVNRYLEVEVTVEKEGYETAKRDYIFEIDSCSCHIRKVSGDDVIIVILSFSEVLLALGRVVSYNIY
jgi:hypothetical protein